MSELPARLSPGQRLTAHWLNRLLDFLRARELRAGPGVKLSRTPSGTTVSVLPDDPPKGEKPKFFECRRILVGGEGSEGGEGDEGGTMHTVCYIETGAHLVALGANLSAPGPAMSRISQNSPWVDLGTGYGIVYLYFVDGGSAIFPRWRWQLAIVDDYSSFPSGAIDHFPIVPIAFVGGLGAITQLHTGSISITEPWFWPVSNGLFIGLKLMGTNGNALAKFNDTDGSVGDPVAEFYGNVDVEGNLTIGGKLNGEKPVWKTITIDGTSHTILCKAATRP